MGTRHILVNYPVKATAAQRAKAELWTDSPTPCQVRMQAATHGALGNVHFLHSQRPFQGLSETPVLEQTYWASVLVRAGLVAGSAIYCEATLGKLLTLPHFVSLYVKWGGILCCRRIIRTCEPRAPDLTHSEQCYGSYCSCMLLRLNPLPLISNKF